MNTPVHLIVRYYFWTTIMRLAMILPFKCMIPINLYILRKKELLGEDMLTYTEPPR